MTKQKCEKCRDPIPKGKEKYAKTMKLCSKCFSKEIHNNRAPNFRRLELGWLNAQNREKLFK